MVEIAGISQPTNRPHLAAFILQSPVGCPAAVCTENLSSGVVVVKSAQNGACTDHTGSLNRARNRRILVQGSMRSDAIVIVGVGFQDPAQMRLAQDNDVVHTFT